MTRITELDLPCITDEDRFEDLCESIWRKKLDDPHTQKNGRRGQRQDGVDIFGKRSVTNKWVGIQSKVRTSIALSLKEIKEEIRKARKFNPKLSEYIIVTTAPRDAKIQKEIRLLSDSNVNEGFFLIKIEFWDDIKETLTEEEFIPVLQQFFSSLMIDVKTMGLTIGNVIQLSIGDCGSITTGYEIILGKVPKIKGEMDYTSGINYWRNIYFIVNLNQRAFETFPIPCHPSDIETAFPGKYGSYCVSKWINSINEIDDVIYGEEIDFKYCLEEQEYREFRELIKEN